MIALLCRKLEAKIGEEEDLGPVEEGASKAEIELLVSSYGFPLPEDYLEFLTIHNGWHGIHWAVDDIFSTEGNGEFIDREEAHELFNDQGDFDEWVVQVRESVLVIGAGNDAQLVYVPREKRFVLYSEGEKDEVFPSFAAFLQFCLDDDEDG